MVVDVYLDELVRLLGVVSYAPLCDVVVGELLQVRVPQACEAKEAE